MRKLIVFLGAWGVLCSSVLFARGIGIGSDSAGLLPPEQEVSAKNLPGAGRTGALEYYIAALLENKDMKKRVDLLLKAAEKDPQNRLISQMLLNTLNRSPESGENVRAFFDQTSKTFPHDIFLVCQSCRLDVHLRRPVKDIGRKALAVLKGRKPKKSEQRYFYQLAALYLDLQLVSDAPVQVLPFEADTVDLLEVAVLYYTSAKHRDMMMVRDISLAQKELDKYLKRLEKIRFENFAEVRRMVSALTVLRCFDTAYEVARRWHGYKPTSEAVLQLIEASAQAGQLEQLDLLLKKYPALPVDFCTRMRCLCLMRKGKYLQAAKTAENFPKSKDRIQHAYWIAQVRRDVKTLERTVAGRLRDLRGSRSEIATMLLSLAEITRDLRYFHQAEAAAEKAIRSDHVLSNAFGYVAAVLDHDLPQAEERVAFALSKQPENAAYLDSMAWVCLKRGNPEGAEKYMIKALQKADFSMSCAVLADHAGDIYFALGQKKKAQRYYQLALKLYRENPLDNIDLDADALQKKIAKRFPGKKK